MPDPKKYDDKDDWMAACVPAVKEEGKDQDQAVAQCMNMWKERDADHNEKKSNNDQKEIRTLQVSNFRFKTDDDKPRFEGYAAVFNKWSEDLGGFRERIKPGAFKNALKNSDVRALFDHDRKHVLGRSTSGTLTLREDKKGLYMSNDPPDTQWARDLMVSVSRGDINQMSFGFTVAEDEWKEDKEGMVTRTIHGIDRLYDVSIVTEPAYPDTTVALRSMNKMKAKADDDKKSNFEVISEPETQEGDIENSQARDNISELKEIAEKLNTFLASYENASDGEPMQAEGEQRAEKGEEGETIDSEPMQGIEEEVRDYWLKK